MVYLQRSGGATCGGHLAKCSEFGSSSSNVKGIKDMCYLLLPGPGVHMMPSLILCYLRIG